MRLQVEKRKGDVKISNRNCLLRNLEDMEELEYWEDRLEFLNLDHLIVYKKYNGKILYSIYTKGGLLE